MSSDFIKLEKKNRLLRVHVEYEHMHFKCMLLSADMDIDPKWSYFPVLKFYFFCWLF